MSNANALAPVAIFVYNRADHTERTLRSLAANTLAAESEVYVFSDGGKDAASWAQVEQVRDFLHRFAQEAREQAWLKSLTIVEREHNYYLERNIIEGIAQVLEEHEQVIVLEDDMLTSPHFLDYMNKAFSLYRDTPEVMHITGFTRLDLLNEHPELVDAESETYFTPHAAGWGWGTWRDRWQKFVHYDTRQAALEGLTEADIATIEYGGAFPALHSLDRSPIPWDICWQLAVHRAGGLALSPAHTLVRNIGLQQGTHFRGSSRLLQRYEYDRPPLARPLALAHRHPLPDARIEALFCEAIRDWGIRYTLLGKGLRAIYRRLRRR